MPSYSIIITRDITESCVTYIDAETPEAAKYAAMEWLAHADDPKWEVDDGSLGTSPAYITDCTEE